MIAALPLVPLPRLRTNVLATCSRISVCSQLLEEARTSDKRVLVHFTRGVSRRSASLILTYLMQSEGSPLLDLLAELRSKRSIVDPNISFMAQLEDFERSLTCSRHDHKINH